MLLGNTVSNVLASFVMPKYATVNEVTLIESGVRPPLVAIDGLPCNYAQTASFGMDDQDRKEASNGPGEAA
jgi:hypothetical protein